MNDTIFIFGVLPLTFAFIGFVYSMIFGPDFLHWYFDKRSAQLKERTEVALAPSYKQAA